MTQENLIESSFTELSTLYIKGPQCYDLMLKALSKELTLVLSNTRELNRELFYKLVYLIQFYRWSVLTTVHPTLNNHVQSIRPTYVSRSLMVDFIFIFSFHFILFFYFQNNLGQGLSVMLSHQSQVDGIVTRLIIRLGRMEQKVLE